MNLISGSFRRQIILAFVVGFCLLVVAFSAYQVKTESRYLYRDSSAETTSMAESLAASSRSWVLANDVAGLQEVVRSFQGRRGLRYAMILSRDGRVLGHSDPDVVGQYVSDKASLSLIDSPPVSRILTDDESMIDIAVPVMTGSHHVGWARVGLGRDAIADNLRKMTLASALFVLLSAALSLIAALLIANRLGYRIQILMRVAEEVQAGDYGSRVEISGRDEIARLAASLNHMLDVLARDEEQLRTASRYTRSLIEASLDPLVTISPEGKITDVNKATEQATGMSRSELVGTDFSEYFTEPDRAREGYLRVFAQGFVTDYPLVLRHRDGHLAEVLYNASVYRNEAGEVLGVFAAARDVTERRRVEEALYEAQQMFRSLVENSPDIITRYDRDCRRTYVNPAYLRETELALPQLLGATPEQRSPLPDDSAEALQALLRRVLDSGAVEAIDVVWRKADNVDYWYNIYAFPELDREGRVASVMTVSRDITERKQSEEILRQSEEVLKESQRIAHLGSWHMDVATSRVVWSEELYRIYGFDPALPPPLYTESMKLFTTESWERLSAAIERAVTSGIPYELELEAVTRDGGRGWMWARGEPVKDANGEIVRVRGVVMNITERKLAENALREKEERLALATVNNGVGIWDWNLQTQRMIWDESMFALYHIRSEDFAGTEEAWRATLHPDDLVRSDREVADAISGRKPFETEFRVLWPDGEIRYIKAVAKVFRDADGNPLRMLGINMDVTDRRKAEIELRELNSDFITLLENSGDFIYFKDKDSRIRFCSQTLARITGHASWREMIGKHDSEIFPADTARVYHDEELPIFGEGRALLNKTDPYYDEDGRQGWVSTNKWPVFGDDKKTVVGIFGISRDITELKLAEDKINELNRDLERRVEERTEQLEAANKELEAFSYSVSHDLRTPLRAIDGFSRILIDDYNDKLDDEGRRLLGVVRDNTSRMGQLIDDILKFSRTGRVELNFSQTDMSHLVRDVFDELRSAGGTGNLSLEVGILPNALCDSAMMRQVFVNLLSNAIKFSRSKPEPKISVGGRVEGGEAVYYVKDNGVGFDMQYSGKLFGVFQRLHGVTEFEGTGIGLAIVKRVITRHGGRVWAEGAVGEGATIYFALPTGEKDHG